MNGPNGSIPAEADIVIVGGGVAGLVAANFATENVGGGNGNASRRKPGVLLLEKALSANSGCGDDMQAA